MKPAASWTVRSAALIGAGRMEEAEACLRAAASEQPGDAQVLGTLGAILASTGRAAEAEPLLRRAVGLSPGSPDLQSNLGNLLRELGRFSESDRCLREAIRLRPDYAEAHLNLALVQRQAGRPRAAERSLRRAIELRPDDVPAYRMLADLLVTTGRPEAGIRALRDLTRMQPELADAHAELGILQRRLGDLEGAAASLETALRLRHDHLAAAIELGHVLHDGDRLTEAEGHYRALIEVAPTSPEAHLGLGVVANRLGRFEEALASLGEALRLRPAFPEALNIQGDTLRNLNRLDEAETALRAALRLRPDDPDTRVTLAFTLLQAGQPEEGWRLHESRWKARAWRRRGPRHPVPLWRGEPLAGRTLLLHAEQGLGDTLQFCRFVAAIAPGSRIVLQVQPPLVGLLAGLARPDIVLPAGAALPPVDVQASLLSLPHLVGAAAAPDGPYLAADPAKTTAWRDRLAHLPGLRVGLVWAGDPTMAADARRSVALAALAPLAQVPGVSFVSLQMGAAARQPVPTGLVLYDAAPLLADFTDTAALVQALDLVIGVDTAVIHLSGALRRPTWLLNRFDTCWRWGASGERSAWYPSLRQFRQPAPGEWGVVVEAVREALAEETARGPRSG